MGLKAKVKSCSCTQCNFGKRTRAGHYIKKNEERAARHRNKIALAQGKEDITAAHCGTRIG